MLVAVPGLEMVPANGNGKGRFWKRTKHPQESEETASFDWDKSTRVIRQILPPTASATESPAPTTHSTPDNGPNPAASTKSRSGASARAAQNRKDDKNQEEQQKQLAEPKTARGVSPRRWSRGSGEINASIGGNYLGDAAGHQENSRVVVILAQIRNGLTPETAGFTVGQNFFEAIPDFRAIAVIVDGKQDQNPAVGLLGTDAEPGGEIDGIVLDRPAAERLDRDHDNLRLRLLIHFRAQSRQLGLHPRAQNMGEVIDVTVDLQLVLRLCKRASCSEMSAQEEKNCENNKLFHARQLLFRRIGRDSRRSI